MSITIFNLHEQTEQAVFEKAVVHLLTQNQKSVHDVDTCMYRSPDGLMCAVGIFIPDDVYDQKLERMSVNAVLERFGISEETGRVKTLILTQLQSLHDRNDPSLWFEGAELIARRWGLDTTFMAPFKKASGTMHLSLIEGNKNEI